MDIINSSIPFFVNENIVEINELLEIDIDALKEEKWFPAISDSDDIQLGEDAGK